jgi:hypothetical protein
MAGYRATPRRFRRWLMVGLASSVGVGFMPASTPAAAASGTAGGNPNRSPHATTPSGGALPDTIYSASLHGGYVSAGVGMRNRGFGHLTLSAIPSGSKITAAFLMWDVLDDAQNPPDSVALINSNFVSGSLIGIGASPCWPPAENLAYEANVTSLVSGNGTYALSGFASGATDGSDPFLTSSPTPEMEGASIVAVYANNSSPLTQVVLVGGATETDNAGASTTISGFLAGSTSTASTTFIVADGQTNFSHSPSTFDGSALTPGTFSGQDPQDGAPYVYGNLWDTDTYQVGSMIASGDTSATITIGGGTDCLVWVGQVLSVASGTDRLVVMGDSYASGEGTYSEGASDSIDYYPSTLTHNGTPGCHRSPGSYAALLGVPAADFVACSGAKIPDIYTGLDGEPSQFRVLDPTVSRVILSVGGDDLGFTDVLKKCTAAPSQPFNHQACVKAINSGVAQLPEFGVDLSKLLVDIYNKTGDHAHIFLMGYPRLFDANPLRLQCGFIYQDDQVSINGAVDKLAHVMALVAVADPFVTFIDERDLFNTHGACAQFPNQPWIRSLELSDAQAVLGGHCPESASYVVGFSPKGDQHVCTQSYHKTAAGFAAEAALLSPLVGLNFPHVTVKVAPPSPTLVTATQLPSLLVPSGMSNLEVSVVWSQRGSIGLVLLLPPSGIPFFLNPPSGRHTSANALSLEVLPPQPGTWQILIVGASQSFSVSIRAQAFP